MLENCDNSASVCGCRRHQKSHHLIIQAGIETVRAARDLREHRLVCDSQTSLRCCTWMASRNSGLLGPAPTVLSQAFWGGALKCAFLAS